MRGGSRGGIKLTQWHGVAWLGLHCVYTVSKGGGRRQWARARALAASDSGSYFLAMDFHIHETELSRAERHLQPAAARSSFSLSQLDFQHFYASKMLRCLLKMLAEQGEEQEEEQQWEWERQWGWLRDSSRWRHILFPPPLSLSLSLHVSIEMNVARRPAVHPSPA